jgi:hypothetical protein
VTTRMTLQRDGKDVRLLEADQESPCIYLLLNITM